MLIFVKDFGGGKRVEMLGRCGVVAIFRVIRGKEVGGTFDSFRGEEGGFSVI